jgi:hypothetical protein
MPWNSDWPVNTISVKANQVKGDQNTKYIQVTMGNSVVGTNTTSTRDHFWNVGANEDGRHRFIQSPAFTVATVAADPVIGTGMDAVEYVKTTNGRAERFHRNVQGIYQYVPSFLEGSVVVPDSYTNVVAVPANVYGEIFMYTTAMGELSTCVGFFRSNDVLNESWALFYRIEGTGSGRSALRFGNGANASGLNIRARKSDGIAGQTWFYRITYRAL